MDKATVGMQGGMSKRTMQQVSALVVALMMLLTTGVQAATPAKDLGKAISVVISKLNPADTTPEQAVESLGGKVGAPLGIIDGFEATIPEAAIDDIAALANVRGLARNAKVKVQAYGENTGGPSAVYPEVSRASKAWTQGVTGKGVGVAVIDTGIDQSGDLAGRVMQAVDFSGENAPTKDSYGHGTFVAGMIAGTGAASGGLWGTNAVRGVAPEAHLISVKIAGRDGSTNVFRLLAALEYVATMKDAYGIRVVNLSLGSDSTQSYKVDPLNFAVERVWNSGIVVVTAAGNNGKIVKPADDPLVISVGALDDKTTSNRVDDAIAGFSGVGPTLSDGIAKPDVVASGRSVISSRSPGSFIEAAFPNALIGTVYFKGSGTSFSAGVVSGAAALVIQKTWSLNPNQVKYRLMNTSKTLANVSSNAQGAGSIDAFNAVTDTSTASANQGVTPAAGTGSLQGSSGSSCYRDAYGKCVPDAEVNAAIGFDSVKYFGSQWGGSYWNGSQWAGSQWGGSQWAGSQWGGSQWAGSQWGGSQWEGSQWGGSQWGGSQWGGSQWEGSQWGGSQWAGSQWGGSQWGGSQWGGSQWGGSQWGSSSWAGLGGSDLIWLGSHWG